METSVIRAALRSVPAAVAALCIAVAPGAAGAATRIVFPPDRALLADGAIEVLGVRDPGPAVTVFTVVDRDGRRPYAAAEGVFKGAVRLPPGQSLIVLGEQTVTVFVEGPDAGKPGPEFSPPDRHAVDNGCEDCHAVKGAQLSLSAPVPDLCGNCHDAVGKGRDGKPHAVAHPPVDEGDCTACHAFHGPSIKGLRPAAKRALCFGCHDDFTGEGKKRMHQPVAEGACTGCHLVHGAPQKALLPASGLKLCLLCHKDPSLSDQGEPWATPHPALDDGCASCHQPHVAGERGLLVKGQEELCFGCHDSFLGEDGKRPAVIHEPAGSGECSGCHNPHGSPEAKILRATGLKLCVRCHDDPTRDGAGTEWATPHPALDDGCSVCHLPHVAGMAALLRKPQAPLCFDCHEGFVKEGEQAALHLPVAQGACARCHAPHGSALPKLLAADPRRALCLKCHQDPSRDAAGGEWPVPHPALDDGCPTCHVPHASAVPKLLPKPAAQVCAACHEDKTLNADGQVWATSHTPVRTGLCGSCHRPHGAPEKALLARPVNETCAACHPDPHAKHLRVEIDPATGAPSTEKAVLPPGFPVRKKDGALGCAGCHQPHGSDTPRLWTRDEMSFCSTCHNKY